MRCDSTAQLGPAGRFTATVATCIAGRVTAAMGRTELEAKQGGEQPDAAAARTAGLAVVVAALIAWIAATWRIRCPFIDIHKPATARTCFARAPVVNSRQQRSAASRIASARPTRPTAATTRGRSHDPEQAEGPKFSRKHLTQPFVSETARWFVLPGTIRVEAPQMRHSP